MPQTTITISGLSAFPSSPSSFANTTVTGGTFTETQTITLSNASGGAWRVAYNGEVSAPLSPTISSSSLKSVLDGFAGIDNVTVTGSSGSFTLTFGGTQSTTNVQQIFGDAADATNGSTTRTITTTYDAANHVASISDPSATNSYTLDNLGRAITISNTISGLTPTVSLDQTFDAMNNRTQLKSTIGSTAYFKTDYTYDALQRLTDVVQQGQSGGNAVTSKHVTMAYNALSRRTNISRYQSTGTTSAVATSDFTYDSDNRLSGIAHKQGTTNLNTYAYTYDPLSRFSTVVSTLEGTDSYTYDQTSQVTGATHTSSSNETYGFDANGNRNTTGYTTGTNNLTTASSGYTYTYDDDGNRTSRTETANSHVAEYTWDYRNRLTTVKERNSSGGSVTRQVDYEYDAMNRLVKRTYDSDGAGSGSPTYQYWAYDNGINAVVQFDGSAASNLSHRYMWGSQVDELLADEQVTSLSSGGNTLWGLADHLGSQRDIADLNEGTGVTSITNHRTYNSFGKLISETNSAVDMLFGFTGKQLDDATNLQHNLFRWYDSSIGQWMSEDPLSFKAGDQNLHRNVKNGVVSKLDPLGLYQPPEPEVDIILLFMQLDQRRRQEIERQKMLHSRWTLPAIIRIIENDPVYQRINQEVLVNAFRTSYDRMKDIRANAINEQENLDRRGSLVRDDYTIKIRSDMETWMAAMTLLHELFHLDAGQWNSQEERLRQEVNARVYAEQFAINYSLPETHENYRTPSGTPDIDYIQRDVANRYITPPGLQDLAARYEDEQQIGKIEAQRQKARQEEINRTKP